MAPGAPGGEWTLIRTLVLTGPGQAESLSSWLDYLRRSGSVSVELTQEQSALRRLQDFDVVVAHAPGAPLEAADEAGLCEFVARGGGYLGLHRTSADWASAGRYLELVGGGGDGRLPRGEIVAEVSDQGHDITRRLGGNLTVRDTCYGQAAPPADSRVLLDTSWQARRLALAYVREPGAGRVFYWGLGGSAETLGRPEVQELLYRGVRYAAGQVERAAVGVGMLGYGAIGEDHAAALEAVPGLELVAVADRSPERLAEARRLGSEPRLVSDLEGLLALEGVELVLISTPPSTHAELAARALAAGRHVVLEKPFCLSTAEADQLTHQAAQLGRTITVFQNRRWDPDFLALRQVVESGRLGRVFHLEAFVGGYGHPCHLWHSHAPVSGGVIYDWGSHYLDWILQLVPERVVRVAASHQKLVWHDVTNDDHFEVRLTFEDGTEAEFIHSDIAAARKPKWYVLGTEGAVLGRWRQGSITSRGPSGLVSEERLAVTDLPCELHVLSPDGEGEAHDQRLSLPSPRPQPYYRNLAGHLLAGEPLAVTAESARRNIAVMEAATRAAETGEPISLLV